jgi:hypothetical protein
VAGRAAAWAAFRKLQDHGDAWHVYFELAVQPALERGLRVPLLDGFARFRAAPRHAAEVRTALAAAAARAPSADDSHPPMPERLRALEPARPADDAPPPPSSCAHLLGGADAAEDAWYSRNVLGRPARVAWGAPAAQGLLLDGGAALAGTPLELSRFTLADVPGLVARAGSLWPSLRRGVNLLSPAAQASAARASISRALALALAARGFTPELWPGVALTLRRGALAVAPDDVVEGLADGSLDAGAYEAQRAAWAGAAQGVSAG